MVFQRLVRDPQVRDRVSLALVELSGMGDNPDDRSLAAEIENVSVQLRRDFAGRPPGEIPLLRPARELYRSFGVDPTRHRPSSEALLRRLLRGEPLPSIGPAVDLANLWAVVSGLPVGLYDTDRLEPDELRLRLGRPEESYEGIRKSRVSLDGKLLLADGRGPFGNPSADSLRASVTAATRRCLFVMFAPSAIDVGVLDRWAGWLRERAVAYLGGTAVSAVMP